VVHLAAGEPGPSTGTTPWAAAMVGLLEAPREARRGCVQSRGSWVKSREIGWLVKGLALALALWTSGMEERGV